MFCDVGSCFTKFHFCQTFLLFPSLMNNVWFIRTACKTLLDWRMRTRLSLILIWVNFSPRILVIYKLFYKTCFTVLDSFGHPVKHCPTLFFKTMLDDVLLFGWAFTHNCTPPWVMSLMKGSLTGQNVGHFCHCKTYFPFLTTHLKWKEKKEGENGLVGWPSNTPINL